MMTHPLSLALFSMFALGPSISCSKSDKPTRDAAGVPVTSADATAPAPVIADAAPAPDASVAVVSSDAGSAKVVEEKPTNLKVLSKRWSTKRVEREMRKFTKALGVKCKHCHVGKDYASDANEKKLAARKMISMTKSMNRKYFKSSKKKLGCVTCHKGKAEL